MNAKKLCDFSLGTCGLLIFAISVGCAKANYASSPTGSSASVSSISSPIGSPTSSTLHFKNLCIESDPLSRWWNHNARLQNVGVVFEIAIYYPLPSYGSTVCRIINSGMTAASIQSTKSLDLKSLAKLCSSNQEFVQRMLNPQVGDLVTTILTTDQILLNEPGTNPQGALLLVQTMNYGNRSASSFDLPSMSSAPIDPTHAYEGTFEFVQADGSLAFTPDSSEATVLIDYAFVSKDANGRLTAVNAGEDASKCDYLVPEGKTKDVGLERLGYITKVH